MVNSHLIRPYFLGGGGIGGGTLDSHETIQCQLIVLNFFQQNRTVTTVDGRNPKQPPGINYLLTGAGCFPST